MVEQEISAFVEALQWFVSAHPGYAALACLGFSLLWKTVRALRIDRDFLFPLSKRLGQHQGLASVVLGLPALAADILASPVMVTLGIRKKFKPCVDQMNRDIDYVRTIQVPHLRAQLAELVSQRNEARLAANEQRRRGDRALEQRDEARAELEELHVKKGRAYTLRTE